MAGSASEIREGMGMMPRALVYLYRNPSLIPWVLGPTLLTLCAITTGITVTVVWAPALIVQLFPLPTDSAAPILWWIAAICLFLSALVTATVGSWVLGSMASSPFYDVIAGRVENAELGTVDSDFSLRRVIPDALTSIRHSLMAIALYIGLMVPLFALNLVPAVGSALYFVASTAATVFFVSREIMDVPLSRRQLGFRDKIRYILDNRERIGGHGAVVALLFLIPLANLLVTPVAVVGASLLFCDIEREKSPKKRTFKL